MIIRATTPTNDWLFGRGLQDYFTGEAAIEANIRTKLLEWIGNCYFNLQGGIDWKNRLGPGQQANLLVDIKNLILNCFGVLSIISIVPAFNANTRRDILQVTIQTIYSPQAYFILPIPVIGVTS